MIGKTPTKEHSLDHAAEVENPWIGYLRARRRWRIDYFYDILTTALLAFPVLWLIASALAEWSGNADGLFSSIQESIPALAYLVLLSLTFIAPALGSTLRARIDRSPMMPEVLLTPLEYFRYSGAVTRYIHGLGRRASIAAGVIFPALFLAGSFGTEAMIQSLDDSVGFLLDVPTDFRHAEGFWFHVAGIAFASYSMALSYGRGIQVRALCLANVAQFKGSQSRRIAGGVLTFVLVGWCGAFGWARLWLCFWMASTPGVLFIFACIEYLVAFTRLALARWLEKRLQRVLPRQYERYIQSLDS